MHFDGSSCFIKMANRFMRQLSIACVEFSSLILTNLLESKKEGRISCPLSLSSSQVADFY